MGIVKNSHVLEAIENLKRRSRRLLDPQLMKFYALHAEASREFTHGKFKDKCRPWPQTFGKARTLAMQIGEKCNHPYPHLIFVQIDPYGIGNKAIVFKNLIVLQEHDEYNPVEIAHEVSHLIANNIYHGPATVRAFTKCLAYISGESQAYWVKRADHYKLKYGHTSVISI